MSEDLPTAAQEVLRDVWSLARRIAGPFRTKDAGTDPLGERRVRWDKHLHDRVVSERNNVDFNIINCARIPATALILRSCMYCQSMIEVPQDQKQLAFVVQKHKATSLHYDFRLEIGGVMPSWSIPKGPSLDSSVKRLALPTGDHSLEYRHFEGVISEGEYGAGPVMVWDEGTYNPEIEISKGVRKEITNRIEAEKVAQKDLKDGNLKFRLYGKKLQGSFALVRTAGFGGRKDSWLLIKHRDEYSKKGYDANDYDFSAVSDRSLTQIAARNQRVGVPAPL